MNNFGVTPQGMIAYKSLNCFRLTLTYLTMNIYQNLFEFNGLLETFENIQLSTIYFSTFFKQLTVKEEKLDYKIYKYILLNLDN